VGLAWNTSQLYTTGVLSVAAAPGLTGDYNNDGAVDAADYVYWRKTGGPPADYNSWRTNFGNTAGNGSAAHSESVPEPATSSLIFIAIILGLIRPMRRVRR
jgi:hypothetical protein